MFKIYQSNKTKVLIQKICKIIKKKKNILEEEIFLVENNYFKQWIQIEIAKKIKIHCNIKYITYKKYIYNILQKSIKKKKFFFLF